MSMIDILLFLGGWFAVSIICAVIFGAIARKGRGEERDDER